MVMHLDGKASSKNQVVLTAHLDPGLPPAVDPAIPPAPDPAGTRTAS